MTTSDDQPPVIIVDQVSKRYRLYSNPFTGPFREAISFWRKEKAYREHWAVDDVSFTIRKNERVGIVGSNGAGKTTVLKMIAGLLPIEKGTIEVHGQVSLLLAVGIGINLEFTGRENIHHVGLLIGMAPDEINEKVPEIIEFAEIGEFIDQPLRTYSSGMRARLMFSISMSVKPDILIVDEALSTGDTYFVQKCQRRIEELCEQGTTIVFVSHNLSQVERICERCLVMEKGALVFDGPTEEAINLYIDGVNRTSGLEAAERTVSERAEHANKGTGEIIIEDAYLVSGSEKTHAVSIMNSFELHIEYEALNDLGPTNVCVEIFSDKSKVPFAFISPLTVQSIQDGATTSPTIDIRKGRGKVVFGFDRLQAGEGAYSCGFQFFSADPDFAYSQEACYFYSSRYLLFEACHPSVDGFGRGTLSELPPAAFHHIRENEVD